MAVAKKITDRDQSFFSETMTDVEREVYLERWSISSNELRVGEGWRIEKHRLRGGLSDGVDIVTVDNGRLSYIIVPSRGLGIWKGDYRGTFVGWNSPVKDLVHPHYLNLEARGGIGWLDGFNEWVVRCGLSSFGAPSLDTIRDNMGREKKVMLTLHGRIANIPASLVKVKIGLKPPFELGVEGVVYERSMFGSNLKLTSSITTFPGSNSLKISDAVENLRGIPDEMQLLYHCNYGGPYLEEGAHLVAPIRRVAPRDTVAAKGIDGFDIFGAPQTGFIEQVYFMDLLADSNGRTKVMLVGNDETKAVSLSFSVRELPYFTLWKNTAAVEEGYVVGLEPCTNFPNPKPFERERKRVIMLKPKGKFHAEIALSVHLGKDEVQKVNEEIEKVREGKEPVIFKEPMADFSSI